MTKVPPDSMATIEERSVVGLAKPLDALFPKKSMSHGVERAIPLKIEWFSSKSSERTINGV